jgi:hypothetical protein
MTKKDMAVGDTDKKMSMIVNVIRCELDKEQVYKFTAVFF